MHAIILVALFSVRTLAPRVVPGPEVVQVALVEPADVQTWTPPAPVRQPEVKAAEIKPTEETGVKLAPPKVTKPPKKEPERAPAPQPSASVPALPSAPVGNAGLRGEISVDAGDFEFTYYLLLVRNRIAQNWSPPAGLETRGQPTRAVVYFRIARRGEISGVRVESGSGTEFFDRSASRAVLISDPLPPLPLGYTGTDLGVHFGFEYATP